MAAKQGWYDREEILAEMARAERHPAIRSIRVQRDDVDYLKFSQVRKRSDWPAVFSCNRKGTVWLFPEGGYHHEGDRFTPPQNPLLDEIVKTYLDIRDLGGRFFVNFDGVYYHPQDGPLFQFIEFQLAARKHSAANAPAAAELRARLERLTLR